MKTVRAWLRRLGGLVPSARRERELGEELEAHLAMNIEDNLRAGMSPAEARRYALLRSGGMEAAKEACRDRSSIPFVENILQDVRFAGRQLRRNPGFTALAVFMLAVGVSATVAIFGFVDAALIKPLPYEDPVRLTGVFETVSMFPRSNLSYLDYLDWKKENQVFRSLEAFQPTGFTMTTSNGAKLASGARVSDGFFRTLGIRPVLGRDFYSGEDSSGTAHTALISFGAWQSRYGGRKDIAGQTVTLNDIPTVIIGVLPAAFHFAPAEPAEFFSLLNISGSCEKRRGCHNLYGIGRLRDGVSIATALANMQSIARQLESRYPDSNRNQGAAVVSLTEAIVGDIRPLLLLLLAGAALLLLIASVNVASLLLVKSESRHREIAVRRSLGASRSRLFRQFLTEGLLLAGAGNLLGLASAYWLMQALKALIPEARLVRMPFLPGAGLNLRVLACAAALSLASAALFSFTPALRLSRRTIGQGLADGSRGSADNTWRRLGSRLVVLELATAMVLLAGAGLLGKSLYRLLQTGVGFEPEHLVTLQILLPNASYPKDEQVLAVQQRLAKRLAALPGVESVGLSTTTPLTHNGNTTWFRIVGRPWHGEHNECPEREVSPGYFHTLRAKLVRGRYFEESEDATKPRVAIINQALAKQYFPDGNALGKQLSYLSEPPVPMEIVGIIEDIKEGPLDAPTPPVLYRPFSQNPDNFFGFVVRTSLDGSALLGEMEAAIRQTDPGILTLGGITLADRRLDSTYLHRSSAWMTGGFAALALLLSVIGLYGVVAFSVSRRTREIGVRMALGAQRSSVLEMVLKEAGWLIGAGLILGLAGALSAAQLMRSLLFGIPSWDLPTLAAVAVVLGPAALLASYIPARRAASVNPVDALRAE